MTEEEKIRKQNELVQKWSAKVSRSLKSNVGSMFHSNRSKKRVYTLSDIQTQVRNRVHKLSDLQSKVIRKPDDPRLQGSIRAKTFKHDHVEIDGVSITYTRHGVFVAKGAGPGTRQPKDWINPVLDKEVPQLADKIGELGADLILKETAKLIGNGKD